MLSTRGICTVAGEEWRLELAHGSDGWALEGLTRLWAHWWGDDCMVENGEKSCGLNAPSLVWRWASSVPGDLAWSAMPSVNTYTRERAKQTGDTRKEKTEGNEEKRKKGKRFISKAIICPHFCSYLFSWQNSEFPLHLFRFFFTPFYFPSAALSVSLSSTATLFWEWPAVMWYCPSRSSVQ